MLNKIRVVFWVLIFLVTCIASYSPLSFGDNFNSVAWQQSGTRWLSFNTAHFQFNYLDIHQPQADRAAIIAEKVWAELTRDFNWIPRDRVQVVLVDDFDISNGFATPLPFNQMRLFLSPPENMSVGNSYDDRMNLLITHELTHVIHLDMAMGAPSVLRKILGRNIFTFPHAFTPGFMAEGLAVYKETNHQVGIGRGQSSNYEMLMRQEVLNGIDDLSQITIPLRDWPFGKQYLYGYYYYQFLVESYGEEKITIYLNQYSRKLLPFFLQNLTARRTFGKNHELLWLNFKAWLKLKFAPQIERIKQQSLVTGRPLTKEGLQFDPVAANREFYYYQRNNGMDRRSIIRLDREGNSETMMSVNHLIDMDVTNQGRLLISRYVPSGDGRGWADIFVIDNGNEKRLTFRQRYRNARWLNQSEKIVAKRIIAGISQLDLLTSEGRFIKQLWRGTLDDVIGDFALSHDGKTLVASVKRKQQGWNLELLDLNLGQWKAITDTRAVEGGARFSEDDREIIFSADYGDTFNLYRMHLASGDIQQLSHVLGGAIKPVQIGDYIFYQNYNGDGYDHYQLAAEQNIETFNIADQQGSYDYRDWYQLPIDHSEPEDYQPWSTLVPRQWTPFAELDSESTNLGFSTTGSDALSRHSYYLTLLYDTDNSLTAGNITYDYDNKWQISAQRSHDYSSVSNSSDINVRREDELEIARINLLEVFGSGLKLSAGFSIDDEQDLTNSGFIPEAADTEIGLFGLRLDFNNTESYSQSISTSWGSRISLIVESNEVLDSDFSGEVVNANWTQFFDLPGNQVFTLNVSGAYGTDSPEPFSLGGEDSLLGQALFGRDTWALRGYDDNVQIGTRIQTNSLEYRLPISNIERNWDLLPVGIGQISANIFIDNGAAWNEDGSAKYLNAIGFELKSELVLGYGLVLPINLGIAYGLDDDEGGSRGYARIGYAF